MQQKAQAKLSHHKQRKIIRIAVSPVKRKRLTIEEAVSEYIESKTGVLSPSSIRGYLIIKKHAINDIKNLYINEVTEKTLQLWISNNAKTYAPKTVKNQFGLVCAALRQNKIDLDYKSLLLPRSPYIQPVIPDETQISKILHIIEGTSVELPVTMAVTLGLRQSEIAGLKWSDYDGQYLFIHSAVVPNQENKFEYKLTTKSEASTRVIAVDPILKTRLDRAEHKSEFISPMLPTSVLRKFQQLCEKHNLPKFTMHAQRHSNASMMLAKNIPDKYAMKRLGQSSNSMLKKVYQHTFDSTEKEVAATVSNLYQDIYNQL